MASTKPEANYSAPALSKGLDLLELLASASHPLSQAEISRALNRSPNEYYRMLAELERRGYIWRDKQGAYDLTLKLIALGNKSRSMSRIAEAAKGPMRQFSEAAGQECHLSALEEGRLVVLMQQPAPGPVSVLVQPGSVHNPLGTASGRLLLAHLERDEQHRQITAAMAHFPKPKRTAPNIKKQLDELAETVTCEAFDESLNGLADFAIRVGDAASGWQLSLATTYFRSAVTPAASKEIRHQLNRCAEAIHQTMGIQA